MADSHAADKHDIGQETKQDKTFTKLPGEEAGNQVKGDDSRSPQEKRGSAQDHESFDNTSKVGPADPGSIDNFVDENPSADTSAHVPASMPKVGGDETGLWDEIKGVK